MTDAATTPPIDGFAHPAPTIDIDITNHIDNKENAMTATDTMTAEPRTGVRNGVDTTALFATLDVVKGDPEIAQFQFRAENQWISGTHSRNL